MLLRNAVARIHPRLAVVVHDLTMVALAWWLAKLLRYTLQPNEAVLFHTLEFPLVLLVLIILFRPQGLLGRREERSV